MVKGVADPRDPNRITYPLECLLFVGAMMFQFRLGSRRQATHKLRNLRCREKMEAMFEVDSCPHGDTLNKTFKRLDPDQLQEAVCLTVEALIRKKVLYPFRLFDKHFVIAVDGTGQFVFNERHCPYCLTRTHDGKTLYYHYVLEAKLVCSNGMAFSIMTEFVENPGENPKKQDCELKAFYRLAEKLKKRFPRLPILLTLDGLFACGPVFSLCKDYGWEFMAVLKDKDLPSVNQEFEALSKLQTENRLDLKTGENLEIEQSYRWADDISYVDSKNQEHIVSVVECEETKIEKEKLKKNKFRWVAGLKVNKNNVAALAEKGGRIRWKIENEGFNVQKNGGYELEHAYSKNYNAAKIFYYLLQLAHAIAQLIEKGSLFRKAFPQGVGSSKNIADRLLEAWRNYKMTKEEFELMNMKKFQIRFDTS